MLYLFTDYGSNDLYLGQLKAALLRYAPSATLIDLLHEAPAHNVFAGAHLLAAMSQSLPAHAFVALAVVDPGVGGTRRPVVLHADGRWYVGPDNGLLSVVSKNARDSRVWEIVWRPDQLSVTFHGRDLFAPIAAMLETGQWWEVALKEIPALDVDVNATDSLQVIYIDHYGNAMTVMRQGVFSDEMEMQISGTRVHHASTFSEVPVGALFWYVNSIGLIEIAGNCCRAAEMLDLKVGNKLTILTPPDRSENA